MFKDPLLNKLVSSFEAMLEHPGNPRYQRKLLNHLEDLSIEQLQSKTLVIKKNLVEHLCYLIDSYTHIVFVDALVMLMNSIVVTFEKDKFNTHYAVLESMGIGALDLIFEQLNGGQIGVANRLLEANMKVLYRHPEFKNWFVDRFFTIMQNENRLNFLNYYHPRKQYGLYVFLTKLLQFIYPNQQTLLFPKQTFMPYRLKEMKPYFYYDLYFNMTQNRQSLLTSFMASPSRHLLNQHIQWLGAFILKYPNLRDELISHLNALIANPSFEFYKNHEEFEFLNNLFKSIIVSIFPDPRDFGPMAKSIMRGVSVFEKLFDEQLTTKSRAMFMETYEFLLRSNCFSQLDVSFHLGDKLPDVVSFFQNKRPDLKTFSDYLDFLYLMHECHIISEEQLNRSLAGKNGEVFQVLMNHPEPEYFFALLESLRQSHYYSVNETQFIIQMRAYLFSRKPLLHAFKSQNELLISNMTRMYAVFFNEQEIAEITACYQGITRLREESHLVFDDASSDVQVDLGFLAEDDLLTLEQGVKLREYPFSALESSTHNTHRFFKPHEADMPEEEMAIIKALNL